MMSELVLVVDDDADIREVIAMLLSLQGYQVVGAADGRAALLLLQGGLRPAVILLDLMMPNLNGWQLREELGRDAALAAIPIIVMTGDTMAAERAAALGAAAYLRKPFEAAELIAALDARAQF